MKNVILAAVVIFLGGLLVSCGKTQEVTKEMNGQTISVKAGDSFTLTLAGNPTTGYVWELSELDQTFVSLTGDPDYRADSNLTGAGGVYTYKFNALKAGTTTLKLIYRRPWEKDISPLETFKVTVEVK
ncbi:MAG: protease inhibitor I42 family protein [Chloroflexi bacterium]|nr:protease inhibitor I42 family protein [Chloroflexota bacterium]